MKPHKGIKTIDRWVSIEDQKYRVRKIVVNPDFSDFELVFLHDALGSVEQWKDFPKRLAIELNINAFLLEREGSGKSSRINVPRDKYYLHKEGLRKLPRYLLQLNIKNPILIGHSDGATIAFLYAAQFHVKGIIGIAPHVFVEDLTLESIRNTKSRKDKLIEKLFPFHKDNTINLIDSWIDTWLSKEFRDWNISEEVKMISCPLLLIQSLEDPYGTKKQIEMILNNSSSEIKRSIWLKGKSHAPHIHLGEELLAKIEKFVNRNILN